jgi:hypothetical protein
LPDRLHELIDGPLDGGSLGIDAVIEPPLDAILVRRCESLLTVPLGLVLKPSHARMLVPTNPGCHRLACHTEYVTDVMERAFVACGDDGHEPLCGVAIRQALEIGFSARQSLFVN